MRSYTHYVPEKGDKVFVKFVDPRYSFYSEVAEVGSYETMYAGMKDYITFHNSFTFKEVTVDIENFFWDREAGLWVTYEECLEP